MTRDEYIATEADREERIATPDNDPDEARLQAEDEAQQPESKLGQQRLIDGVIHVCIEDNGDRGLWRALVDLPIQPTALFRDADIADCPVVTASQPKLTHCGYTMQVDRHSPERQHCEFRCDYQVRVRPFGYAPGWTVHEFENGQEVKGRYTVIREPGHVDREVLDAIARRVAR